LDRDVNGRAAASSCGKTRGISFLTSMTSPGSTGVVSFASRTTAWPFRVRVMLIKCLAALSRRAAGVLELDVSIRDRRRQRDFQFVEAVASFLQFCRDLPLECGFDLLDLEVEISRLHLQARDVRQQPPDVGFLVRRKDAELESRCSWVASPCLRSFFRTGRFAAGSGQAASFPALPCSELASICSADAAFANEQVDLISQDSALGGEDILFVCHDQWCPCSRLRRAKAGSGKSVLSVALRLETGFAHEPACFLRSQLIYALRRQQEFGNAGVPQQVRRGRISGEATALWYRAAVTDG